MIDTVSYNPKTNEITLIDQSKLPFEFKLIKTRRYEDTAECIRAMKIRGAGAIGAIAAFGFAQGIRNGEFYLTVYKELLATRPTAVDLKNGLDYVLIRLEGKSGLWHIEKWAQEFASRNKEECASLGVYGAPLIKNGMNILTHCNAGKLAFVNYGSALAPIYEAKNQKKKIHVYVDETRPRLQGAQLTAWELSKARIPHTIITDNTAGFLMSQKKVDLVIVGADRILKKTGEVFNKIGTYSLAILAKYHKIPFYVAAPNSTIDNVTKSSKDVVIEQRSEEECSIIGGKLMYNVNSRVENWAFDITPKSLITNYIMPNGILKKI